MAPWFGHLRVGLRRSRIHGGIVLGWRRPRVGWTSSPLASGPPGTILRPWGRLGISRARALSARDNSSRR
eukprot:4079339-Pyramimonas_sp.AAC.1